METTGLQRFLEAHAQTYRKALDEIKSGRKTTHWMWFIFPQLKGLGHSQTAQFYAIEDLDEAKEFLSDPVLGRNLIEISSELLKIDGKSANDIFGHPDDLKLHSSTTLFAATGMNDIFDKVLDNYFGGTRDQKTVELLQRENPAR